MYIDVEKKLKDFNLKIQFEATDGVTGLLGASGSGKSMTLRCIAGIDKPDRGRIVVNDRIFFDSKNKINLAVQKRNVGFLFQNHALFPNMTVESNIIAGMKKKESKTKEILEQHIKQFRLVGLEKHYPAQLSGGQQQRVALARIFARNPDVLLLDEPFSALDTFLKWELSCEISEILKSYEHSTLFVSHSRDEIFNLCDKVAVLDNGKVDKIDVLRNVFSKPELVSVTKLTGCKNISAIKHLGNNRFEAVDWGVALKVAVPLTPQITHIGIRSHFFEPTNIIEENTIEIEVINVIESQFKVSVLFKPLGKRALKALCWDFERINFEKVETTGLPRFLKIAAQNIMLLRE